MTPEAEAGWRDRARSNPLDFSRWMFFKKKNQKFELATHHHAINAALLKVYAGQTKRLIINIPPRYSKTELAVVNFMAWAIGQHPDSEFIHASYSARLATNNSWNCRSLLQHPEYAELFPNVHLRDDSAAKDEWRTTAGGMVYAVGTGGTITGYGAGKMRPGFGGCVIIDDPLKADEARSDIMRANVREWFQNTLESRCNSPETPIVVIMQRLHEDDLSGWLLGGGNGEKWDHLCLPAIKANGEALWPFKHSIERLRAMEEASPYNFAGQYLQRPAPLAGGIIKPDNMIHVDAIPAGTQFVRAWDLASSEGRGDWTVGAKFGKMPDGRYIIADIIRIQAGPDGVRAAIKGAAESDGTACRISIPQDPGQAGKGQAQDLVRMLAHWSVTATPESGDKVTRADPFAAQINVGNVLILNAEWNNPLKGEMRLFPNGKHDDQIDALSRAFNSLHSGNDGLLDYFRAMRERG